MQDRVQKTKDEVQKCREKYEQSLQEINKYNPIYMEDMTSVFIKCQELEETRLRFFKNVLFSIHKTLNVTQDPKWVAPLIFYHGITRAADVNRRADVPADEWSTRRHYYMTERARQDDSRISILGHTYLPLSYHYPLESGFYSACVSFMADDTILKASLIPSCSPSPIQSATNLWRILSHDQQCWSPKGFEMVVE